MTESMVKGTTLELRRRFKAAREDVFAAWIDADALRRWYAPVEGWVVSRAEVDASIGGGYLLEFGPPGSDPVIERGTYLEIDPPARLVIRVHLEGRTGSEDTTVTISFEQAGDETEVVITEGEYSSADVARRHAGGWTTMLEQLARLL